MAAAAAKRWEERKEAARFSAARRSFSCCRDCMRARIWLRRREGEEGVGSGDAPYRLLVGLVWFSIVDGTGLVPRCF